MELALFSLMLDDDLAKQIGKTTDAVRRPRILQKIAMAKDRRRKG
jgi:hypothetical protein